MNCVIPCSRGQLNINWTNSLALTKETGPGCMDFSPPRTRVPRIRWRRRQPGRDLAGNGWVEPGLRRATATWVDSTSGLPRPHTEFLLAADGAKARRGWPPVFQGHLLQVGRLGPRPALQTVNCVRIVGSGHAITPPTMALLSSEIVTPPATNTPPGPVLGHCRIYH